MRDPNQSPDSRRIEFKTDRNAVFIAIIVAIQAVSIALIERNYRIVNDSECAKIGIINDAN